MIRLFRCSYRKIESFRVFSGVCKHSFYHAANAIFGNIVGLYER